MRSITSKFLDDAGLTHILTKIHDVFYKKQPVTQPIFTPPTFTYNGSVQKPTTSDFTGFDSETMELITEETVNAGTYTFYVALKDVRYFYWDDDTTEDKPFYYTIGKADNTISVSPNSISGTKVYGKTETSTATTIAGVASATTSNTSVATASVSGNNVVVTFKGKGTATITVASVTNNNYNSKTTTISVNVTEIIVPVTWANGTDEQIVKLIQSADAGLIDLYDDCGWRVGDTRSITITSSNYTPNSSSQYTRYGRSTLEGGTYDFVLMDRGNRQTFTLTTSVLDKNGSTRNKPSFVVGMTFAPFNGDIIAIYNHIRNTPESSIIKISTPFMETIPSTIRPIFKQFSSLNGATDKYADVASSKEITNNATLPNMWSTQPVDISSHVQLKYCETAANRIKTGRLTGWGQSGYGACVYIARPMYTVQDGSKRYRASMMIDSNGNAGHSTTVINSDWRTTRDGSPILCI